MKIKVSKKAYILGFIAVIMAIICLKYQYDKSVKEKERIEKLNNDIKKIATDDQWRFNDAFKPVGEPVIKGLKNADVRVKDE